MPGCIYRLAFFSESLIYVEIRDWNKRAPNSGIDIEGIGKNSVECKIGVKYTIYTLLRTFRIRNICFLKV